MKQIPGPSSLDRTSSLLPYKAAISILFFGSISSIDIKKVPFYTELTERVVLVLINNYYDLNYAVKKNANLPLKICTLVFNL